MTRVWGRGYHIIRPMVRFGECSGNLFEYSHYFLQLCFVMLALLQVKKSQQHYKSLVKKNQSIRIQSCEISEWLFKQFLDKCEKGHLEDTCLETHVTQESEAFLD